MTELERLIQLLAKLPGLGPRSARRAALYLIKRRESVMEPLAASLKETAEKIHPCSICRDPKRDRGIICVVEDMADLWAIERSGAFNGVYHVLGGTLSALDGIGPEDLRIEALAGRVVETKAREVILAMNANVEGQTTAHYILDRLAPSGVHVSRL